MKYTEMMEEAAKYVAQVRPKIETPADVDYFVRPLVHGMEQECLIVLSLTANNSVLSADRVTVGLVDKVQSHPREVFRIAIIANAAKVILVHNHPSGSARPSKSDVLMTKAMQEAGEVIGIHVEDHIIIHDEYTSMREEGLLISKY